jgi:hypothetical protein
MCDMNLTDTLTLLTLALNLIMLGIIAYQTHLNRKALEAARSSIELSIKAAQIEMLPKAGWAIHVRVKLKIWIDDLTKDVEQTKKASEKQDSNLMKHLSDNGLKSPKGLVEKYSYEHAPNWLSLVLMSGAQYYYDAKIAQINLYDNNNGLPKFDFILPFIERCENSLKGLNDLLKIINDIVPEVYLNCPARLNNSEFLDG